MTSQLIHKGYDVVIVGARVAGAATAMLLAAAGLRVLAFDKSRYGTDTLSTHALMRPAVLLLEQWGLVERLRAAGTPPIRNTTFWYSDEDETVVQEIPIKSRNGVDALYAPRRTVLDPLLVDAAREAGAEVRHGLRFVDVLRNRDGRVTGVIAEDRRGMPREIRADLVIGADGRSSRVARCVGANAYIAGRHGSATAYGYFRDLPVDGNRWYFRPGMGSGAIPTNGEETLVFASISRDALTSAPSELRRVFGRTVARSAPDIGARLGRARLTGKLHLFPGMPGYLRQPSGRGWALVGDAGYMSDPITAHGMTNALRDAALLSKAIVDGSALERFREARDELSTTFFHLSDRIASCEWDVPTLQQYHRAMNEEMRREEAFLLSALGPVLEEAPMNRVNRYEAAI